MPSFGVLAFVSSGRGYRDRINNRNQAWFEQHHHGEYDTRVVEIIQENWGKAIESVRGLLTGE